MKCELCDTRKPRRYCPGVRGDICPQCCGTEREVTVSCPLDCEYLLEARRHERFPELDPKHIPNGDVRVTEAFLEEHDALIGWFSRMILDACLMTPGAVDNDLREALETMIQTYRTRMSGLIYETRPNNPIAGAIQARVFQAFEETQRAEAQQRGGVSGIRDASVLGVLVFLQRVALHWNNQRSRGRSLISFLLARYGEVAGQQQQQQPPPSLVLP